MNTIIKSQFYVLCTMAALALGSFQAHAEQEGHGGDNVEPLFFEAQKKAVQIILEIKADNIALLDINEPSKSWLAEPGHLAKYQFYVKAMKLVFQEGPCLDQGNPRGTCFDDKDPMKPLMIISRQYNRNTTPSQAAALVFHEAGHFTGEHDHLFLSSLGVEIVAQQAIQPRIFMGKGVGSVGIYSYSNSGAICAENGKKAAIARAQVDCAKAGFRDCKLVASTPVTWWTEADQMYCEAEAVVHGR